MECDGEDVRLGEGDSVPHKELSWTMDGPSIWDSFWTASNKLGLPDATAPAASEALPSSPPSVPLSKTTSPNNEQ